MGVLSKMVSENMGTAKNEVASNEQQRGAAAMKLGGDGIERMLSMKERTLSQLEASELRDEVRDGQRAEETEAGDAVPEIDVVQRLKLTGNKARDYAKSNGMEF